MVSSCRFIRFDNIDDGPAIEDIKITWLPKDNKGEYVYIYFGAVDEQAWVYLNGKFVGQRTFESDGGKDPDMLWTRPFMIDVTKLVHRDGPNNLAVRVHNYALQVKKGVIDDPTFLPIIYAIDDDNDNRISNSFSYKHPSLNKKIQLVH